MTFIMTTVNKYHKADNYFSVFRFLYLSNPDPDMDPTKHERHNIVHLKEPFPKHRNIKTLK